VSDRPDTDPLAHRVAVVTGASSGIGVAIALGLGELGWSVAIGARRAERLADVAADICRRGGKAFAHPLDVTSPESVAAFFDATEAELGPVEVVVNNAGISVPGPLHEVPPEELEREVRTNLLGPMYVLQRALPALLKRRAGDLVFISSDTARAPRPYQVSYSATKGGLETMARALELELEGSGIRISTLRVGPTASEFAAGWEEGVIQELLTLWQKAGIQRHMNFMPAEQIAAAVVHAVTAPSGTYLPLIELQPVAPSDS
jgi:NAD(P)-dependent dehydrogenase (short-subunit alcohol dehydrogenase family)